MSEISEKYKLPDFRKATGEEIEETLLFYPADEISESQKERMKILNQLGAEFCHVMHKLINPSADRSAAIRSLRLAVMQANCSIAHEK